MLRKCLLIVSVPLLGCFHTDARPIEQPVDRYLTIFLIDGLANDVFTEELEKGRLPNIGTVIGEGAYVETGITSFPSVSGYALYPFLTGEPGTDSGVFGLRWFDRSREEGNFRNYVGRTGHHFNNDLTAHTPTVFEQFPAGQSVAFNSLASRGVEDNETLGMDFLLAKYRTASSPVRWLNRVVQIFNTIPRFGLGDDVATNFEDVERKVVKLAMKRLESNDRIQLIVFTTPDNISHLDGHMLDGAFNPVYVRQLRLIDELIGAYREKSREEGTESSRIYLITSDHGINQVTENISVVGQLQENLGLTYDRDTSVRRSGSLDKALSEYLEADVDVIQALQGNNMSFLYFKNPNFEGVDAWHEVLSQADVRAYPIRGGTEKVDLVGAVSSMAGVELVVHKAPDPDSYTITASLGASEIRSEADGAFSYRLVAGQDPLGYEDLPLGVPLGEDEWLRLTYDRAYPYAVPLLGRLLSAHPDADMIVTTKEGFDHGLDFEFVVGNYRGGHGGIDRSQMVVPFILMGPGVRAGERLPYARPADVGSTIQHLMRLPPAHPDKVLRGLLTERP